MFFLAKISQPIDCQPISGEFQPSYRFFPLKMSGSTLRFTVKKQKIFLKNLQVGGGGQKSRVCEVQLSLCEYNYNPIIG